MASKEDYASGIGITWSDSDYELPEFLDLFTLPQVVQVAEGTYGVSEESTLPAGQVLTIHVTKTTKMYRGLTYEGHEVLLPMNCTQKVEVRPQNVCLDYDTVEELCAVFPRRVKYVRVTRDHVDPVGPERSLKAGQKLRLEYIDRSNPSSPDLICLDEDGCEVMLSMNIHGGFQPLADNNEYFLAELSEHFPLPLYVQFTSPPQYNSTCNSTTNPDSKLLTGLIQLDEVAVEHTVIASSREGKRKTILSFPRTLDVSVIPAEQAIAKDPTYARFCNSLNDGVDLQKVQSIIAPENEVIYGSTKQIVREISCSESLFGDENSGLDVNTNRAETKSNSDSAEDSDNHEYIDIDDPYEEFNEAKAARARAARDAKTRTHDSGVNSRNFFGKLPWSKSKRWLQKTGTSNQESSTSSLGGDDTNRTGSSSTTVEFVRESSIYDSRDEQDEDDEFYIAPEVYGQSFTLTSTPMPGSHVMDPSPDDANYVDVDNQRGDQTGGYDIREMTVGDVAKLLQSLNMGKYVEHFKKEQVDGGMLSDLDKTILRDHFKMSSFHALKLTKAVEENWRPNKQ